MGFSISWLAVKGVPPAEFRARLSLTPTGRTEEIPESPYNGASLPGGWELLVMEGCDHELLGEDSLRRLSAGVELVAASVEEHVMASLAQGWKDGRLAWSLHHQSDEGIRHLDKSVTPPAAFAAIKDKAFADQKAEGPDADVDHIFDIPLSVAQALTGFKHDEGGPDKFEILERASKPGFWGRVFSRR